MNTLLPVIHQPFLKILKEYRDTAPEDEYAAIDELSAYVTEREDCFERKREEGARHIAAAVLLVTPDFELSYSFGFLFASLVFLGILLPLYVFMIRSQKETQYVISEKVI